MRENGTGDGLSWEDAMGSINGAVNKALAYNNKLSEEDRKDADKRAQVWVAAGTYAENPVDNSPACFIIKEGVDVQAVVREWTTVDLWCHRRYIPECVLIV